jgi:hypothetical protein
VPTKMGQKKEEVPNSVESAGGSEGVKNGPQWGERRFFEDMYSAAGVGLTKFLSPSRQAYIHNRVPWSMSNATKK